MSFIRVTHLHVSVVRWVEIFSQGPGAGPLTPVGVIFLGKDDPRPPADLIEVHAQVHSPAEAFFASFSGGLQAPQRLLPVSPFAPGPPGPAGLSHLGGRQKLGLSGCVEQSGLGL